MSDGILELVVFDLADGVERADFEAAAVAVSDWAARQPGFRSRELSFSETSGRWVDAVRWDDLDSAHAAAELAPQSDACAPMFSMIAPDSMVMLHAEPVLATAS